MAILNFPPNPVNGQQYPDPSLPGVNLYEFSSAANTWLLIGRAGYAQAGTYGNNVTSVEITTDASGLIRNIVDRPIPDVTNTQKGLLTPGTGLNVTIPGRVDLIPPTLGGIGGVKAGNNILIAPDGAISVPYATLATPGAVILNNTTSSTDITQALTAAQGKYLQDQISSLVTDALTFCGTYNATTSQLDYVTYEGSLKGFTVGQNLPAPSAILDGTFVVVSVPGTPVAPAPAQPVGSGDWIVGDINPAQWVVVPIGRFIVASQVIYSPYSYVTGSSVQLALNQVIDRTNFFSLSGGIGLSDGPYTLAGGAQTINLLAPTATEIGGVRAGANIVITPSGVISAVAGGAVGSVTEVDTGTGLEGGPITNAGTISISNTGVSAGDYTLGNFTVNAQGQLTAASNGNIIAGSGLTGGGTGTSVTLDVGAGTGITVGADTVNIANTGVTAGTYGFANITVNAQGQLTAAADGDIGTAAVTSVTAGDGLTGGGGPGVITLAVGAGTGITVTANNVALSDTAVTPGSYSYANITVDAQGRLTAASDGTPPVTGVLTGTGLTTTGGTTPTLSLAAATTSELGGVIPDGTTITVQPDGTISAIGGGSGTVTQVSTGTGLTGGPITTTGTISLAAGGISDTEISATAAISGTKLAFTPAVGSGVTRTVQNKERDVVSVKDFGAVGDGVVDDTAAFTALINYCNTSATAWQEGLYVYVPRGRYRITAALPTITRPLSMFGCGRSQSRFEFIDCDGLRYDLSGIAPANVYINSTIKDISFETNVTTRTGLYIRGRQTFAPHDPALVLDGVSFDRTYDYFPAPPESDFAEWAVGVDIYDTDEILLNDCYLSGSAGNDSYATRTTSTAIRIELCTGIRITNTQIFRCGTGIDFSGQSEGLIFLGGTVVAATIGLRFHDLVSPANNHVITGSHFACYERAITFEAGGDGSIANFISDCFILERPEGGTPTADYIAIEMYCGSTVVANTVIQSNSAARPNRTAIKATNDYNRFENVTGNNPGTMFDIVQVSVSTFSTASNCLVFGDVPTLYTGATTKLVVTGGIDANEGEVLRYRAESHVLSDLTGVENFVTDSDANDPVSIKVNGTLKRVQVGAPDSGGVGFRALIVPN